MFDGWAAGAAAFSMQKRWQASFEAGTCSAFKPAATAQRQHKRQPSPFMQPSLFVAAAFATTCHRLTRPHLHRGPPPWCWHRISPPACCIAIVPLRLDFANSEHAPPPKSHLQRSRPLLSSCEGVRWEWVRLTVRADREARGGGRWEASEVGGNDLPHSHSQRECPARTHSRKTKSLALEGLVQGHGGVNSFLAGRFSSLLKP